MPMLLVLAAVVQVPILGLNWTTFASIAVAVLTVKHWLGPILIRLQHRERRIPDMREWDGTTWPEGQAAEGLDLHWARQSLRSAGTALGELGFQYTGGLQLHGSAGGVHTFGLLFEPAGGGDLALIGATQSRTEPTVRDTLIQFRTHWSDGHITITATCTQPRIFPTLPKYDGMGLRTVKDIHTLYRLHRHRVAQHRSSATPLVMSRGDAPVAVERALMERELASVAAAGYWWPDGEWYRPTWKGALLMTWRLLFPLRHLRQSADARRERLLIATAGAG